VRRERPPVHDARPHPRRLDPRHLHRQQPVVQQDARAHARVLGQLGVRRGQLVFARLAVGGKDDLLPGDELAGRLERADADARTLQVHQDGDRHPARLREPAHGGDPPAAHFGRPVRRVHAHHVDPGIDQGGDPLVRPGRGAQGGDDLGPADHDPSRVVHIST